MEKKRREALLLLHSSLLFLRRALAAPSATHNMPPPGPPGPSPAAPPPGGALGEALIPTINRLHDIFSTVRRERKRVFSRRTRESGRSVARMRFCSRYLDLACTRLKSQASKAQTKGRLSAWREGSPNGRRGGAAAPAVRRGACRMRLSHSLPLPPLSPGRPRPPRRPAPGRRRRRPERGQVQRAGVAGEKREERGGMRRAWPRPATTLNLLSPLASSLGRPRLPAARPGHLHAAPAHPAARPGRVGRGR